MHRAALLEPRKHLGAAPYEQATVAEGEDRSRHVWVAALVATHAVALREAKKVGDTLRVDEVVGVDQRGHGNNSLLVLTRRQGTYTLQK